jgi:protein subunit release factor A
MTPLERHLREQLHELEKNHEYSIATDSVRALMDTVPPPTVKDQALKEILVKNLVFKKQGNSPGGQSVAIVRADATVRSEDLDIEISVGTHRSFMKNREIALKLMLAAIDDYLNDNP